MGCLAASPFEVQAAAGEPLPGPEGALEQRCFATKLTH